MAKEIIKLINKFYAGNVRDDKSKAIGGASNVEELDIFGNADFIQAEQIMSSDSIPTATEIFSYAAGDDDTVYGYGRKTTATIGTVRLVSVATGGADNPGTFGALFTSADTTNLASVVSDLKFFRSTEASNPTSLYYIQGATTNWYLSRYNIGAAAEQTWNGSAWVAGTANASSRLTGLDGSFMRPTMKVIFGELFICNGRYIAKLDDDAVFTEKAFTLPSEWEAVDIIPVSDVAIILARNKNRLVNESRGFWWDLTTASQFDDQFVIPAGGPCWIFNHRETIKVLTAINGQARIWQLASASAGAVPLELPNIQINNVATETSTQPISSPKMISTKDKILYFGLYKTDKTGIYAVGQLDLDKPQALILSKRFDTTDYSLHKPTALLIQGPNYYAAFDDNGTADHSRCETNNSPTRSSNATYESIWIDGDEPSKNKQLRSVRLFCKKLPASTTLTPSVATDYDDTYTSLTRADGTVLNTTNAVMGKFPAAAFNNKKAFKVRVVFASSTTNSPKLQAIGLEIVQGSEQATI